ncbi:hypothetical protein MASR2M15_03190 [Anaerolineales bacterium]
MPEASFWREEWWDKFKGFPWKGTVGERGAGEHIGIALICPKPLSPSPEGEGLFFAKGIEEISSFLKKRSKKLFKLTEASFWRGEW